MTLKELIESGTIPEPVSWWDYRNNEGNEEGRRRKEEAIENSAIISYAVWYTQLTDEQIEIIASRE